MSQEGQRSSGGQWLCRRLAPSLDGELVSSGVDGFPCVTSGGTQPLRAAEEADKKLVNEIRTLAGYLCFLR